MEIVNECKQLTKNNTSGYRGVHYRKSIKKWAAKVTINYEDFSLGVHTTKIEAICHRIAAEHCLGFKYPQTIPTRY